MQYIMEDGHATGLMCNLHRGFWPGYNQVTAEEADNEHSS